MAGIVIVLAGFLLHWLAIVLKWERIQPYTKALSLIILIVWTLFGVDYQSPWLAVLLITALLFGLAGDVFLALSDKWFTVGLGAFLLGHLTYLGLIGVVLIRSRRLGLITRIPGWSVVPISIVFLTALLVFDRVIVVPMRKGDPEKSLVAALFVYAFFLTSLVVFSAFMAIQLSGLTWKIWSLALGGILFFISDFILAYDRFVSRVRFGKLWVMTTYHMAQFFLAFGFITLIGLLR